MHRKRRLYIIPGFGESTRSKNYKAVKKLAKNYGYIVKPLNIKWEERVVMSKYINELKKLLTANAESDYILGFSFGALILAAISSEKNFSKYIFCSMSPYFSDDIKNIPRESQNYFGKRFINDLKKISFPSENKNEAWFIVGKKDWTQAAHRAEKSYKLWQGKKRIIHVENAGHEMTSSKYIKALEKALK